MKTTNYIAIFMTKRLLLKIWIGFSLLLIAILVYPLTAKAVPIKYDFNFSATFGPQPKGSFTYDDTSGAERFTTFFIDVNPDYLNESYTTLGPNFSRMLFDVLDGLPSSYPFFIIYRKPNENIWYADGKYEFAIPKVYSQKTHIGTFTISKAPATVPEPSTIILFGSALASLLGFGRKYTSTG